MPMNLLHDTDDGLEDGHRLREESVRRAQLYGISSKKKLPRVQVPPSDARTRKELQLLTDPPPLVQRDGFSIHEHEMEQRKHHEHLGIRPALDQSHPLQDLYTTVPRRVVQVNTTDKPMTTVKHTSEWRVGYKNEPQSEYHGVAMRGVFEPSDTTRERLVRTTENYRLSSTALAYPTQYTSSATVAQQLKPFDADKECKQLEVKLQAGMETSPVKKKHWSSAFAHGTPVANPLGSKSKSKAAKMAMQMDQRVPVRKVESPLKKMDLQADVRHVRRQQAIATRVNEAYAEIQRQAEHSKDPTVRYSLPIENPQFERAYRLGLDPVDSSSAPLADCPQRNDSDNQEAMHQSRSKKATKKTRPPLLFRPKSAVSLGMETAMSPRLTRATSSASLVSSTRSVGKVAGAKRRPHSATVSYLSSSTVYFMNGSSTLGSGRYHGASPPNQMPPSTASSEDSITAALVSNAREVLQEQKKYGAHFLGVVLEERARRHELQRERFFDLARRGLLHAIPLPQIFARLRREALKNLTKRIEHARYEKLSMEDFMSICGMTIVPETSPPRHDELREMRPIQDDDGSDDDDEQFSKEADKPEVEGLVIQVLRDEVELRQLPFDEPANSVFRKRSAIRPDPTNGNNSSTVQAMRKALYVTREQFHIAMEAFALPTRDVNLLFSSLDLNVDDNVPLWEIVCAVEQLQDGHEEIRRARVQVKARHLPKELSALRQSVSVPHHTHVALPLGSR